MQLLKRHKATVYLPTLNEEDNEIMDPTQVRTKTIQCVISPMTGSTAFVEYGINVTQPSQLITEVTEGLELGGKVVFNDEEYIIRFINSPFTLGGLPHIEILLEKVSYN